MERQNMSQKQGKFLHFVPQSWGNLGRQGETWGMDSALRCPCRTRMEGAVASTQVHHVPDSVVVATDGKQFRIDEWFRGEPRVWLLPGDGTARVFFRFVGVPVALREPCEVTGRVGRGDDAPGGDVGRRYAVPIDLRTCRIRTAHRPPLPPLPGTRPETGPASKPSYSPGRSGTNVRIITFYILSNIYPPASAIFRLGLFLHSHVEVRVGRDVCVGVCPPRGSAAPRGFCPSKAV